MPPVMDLRPIAVRDAELLRLRRWLRGFEFSIRIDGHRCCPVCFDPQPNHAPGCGLAGVLAGQDVPPPWEVSRGMA